MGVTIHFKLRAPPRADKPRAKEIMTQLRECALRYGCAGRVDSTTPDIEVLENDRFSPQFGSRVL
jgi:hypothetical protein